ARDISGIDFSGETGGFGFYRARSTLGGTYHGVDGVFSGTVYHSTGPTTLFFPAFDSPDSNYGIARNLDGDSATSLFGSLHFQHFMLQAIAATREKAIPTASYGQVFNDNRSQTIDSSGHLDLRYSRTVFRDTELTADFYFDR